MNAPPFSLGRPEVRALAIRTHGVRPCACCGEPAYACPYAKLPGQCAMGSCEDVATHVATYRNSRGVVTERRPCCERHTDLAIIGACDISPI